MWGWRKVGYFQKRHLAGTCQLIVPSRGAQFGEMQKPTYHSQHNREIYELFFYRAAGVLHLRTMVKFVPSSWSLSGSVSEVPVWMVGMLQCISSASGKEYKRLTKALPRTQTLHDMQTGRVSCLQPQRTVRSYWGLQLLRMMTSVTSCCLTGRCCSFSPLNLARG